MKPATVLPSLSLWIFALLCAILLLHMPSALSGERVASTQAQLIGHWTKVDPSGQVVCYAQLTGPARVRLHLPAASSSESVPLVSEYIEASAQTLYRVEMRLCRAGKLSHRSYRWEIEGAAADPLSAGPLPLMPNPSFQTSTLPPSPCNGTNVLRPFLHESDSPSATFSHLPALRPKRARGTSAQHPST